MKELENESHVEQDELDNDTDFYYAYHVDLTGAANAYSSTLDQQKKIEYVISEEYRELTSKDLPMEEERPLNHAFQEGYTEKYYAPNGDFIKTYTLSNKDALDKYKEFVSKTAQKWDRDFENIVSGDDEYSRKTLDYVKAVSSDKLRRLKKGYPDGTLKIKTPLACNVDDISANFNNPIYNDGLRKNIIKWNDKYPIYDYVIESSRLLNTFEDYYLAQDKNGGSLPLDKEKAFRQKIYDGVVAASAYYNKLAGVAEDNDMVGKLYEDQIVDSKNSPSVIHPRANRGSAVSHCALSSYKMGLENGWPLEDIPVISSFYYAAYIQQTKALFEDVNIKYDEPKYINQEHKEFIEGMLSYYEGLKDRKIQSAEEKNKILSDIDNMMKTGLEKGFLFEKNGSRYNQCKKLREKELSKNVERPQVFEPVSASEDRRLQVMFADLNTERTDWRFRNENKEHKNLRIAAEELEKFMKENPAPGKAATKEELSSYASKYLGKLDKVKYFADIYKDTHKKRKSSGGKARLKGAEEFSGFVTLEKDSLYQRLVKNGVLEENADLDSLRKSSAVEKMRSNLRDINDMQALPTDAQGKRELIEKAAEILVGKLASARGKNIKKAFATMGADLMKDEILSNKGFKSAMKTILKDRTMTPAKLGASLSGDEVFKKIQNLSFKFIDKGKASNKRDSDVKEYENNRKIQFDKKIAKAQGKQAGNHI